MELFNNYKLIMFDLWETLIFDHIENINDIRANILNKYFNRGQAYWKVRILDNIDNFKKNEQLGIAHGEVERFIEIIGDQEYDDNLLSLIIQEMDNIYLSNLDKIIVNHDFDEVLSSNKDIVLVSNSGLFSARGTRVLLGELGLLDKFKKLYLSSECGYCKPNPKFLSLPLDEFGLKPQEVLMIGDSWNKDIVPCKNLNIDTYWLKNEKI